MIVTKLSRTASVYAGKERSDAGKEGIGPFQTDAKYR
jgi:hypothetical protein